MSLQDKKESLQISIMFLYDKLIEPTQKVFYGLKSKKESSEASSDISKSIPSTLKKVAFAGCLAPFVVMADSKVALIGQNPNGKNKEYKLSSKSKRSFFIKPIGLSTFKYATMTYSGDCVINKSNTTTVDDQITSGLAKWSTNAILSQLIDPTIIRATQKLIATNEVNKLPNSRFIPSFIIRDSALLLGSELSAQFNGIDYVVLQSMIFGVTTTAHLIGVMSFTGQPIQKSLESIVKGKRLPSLMAYRLIKVQLVSLMAIGPDSLFEKR